MKRIIIFAILAILSACTSIDAAPSPASMGGLTATTPAATRLYETKRSPDNSSSQDIAITSTATPTAILHSTVEISKTKPAPTIPTCHNNDQPLPLDQLQTFGGTFFYTDLDRVNLFGYGGTPAASRLVVKSASGFDEYAFSRDGEWLIGYPSNPHLVPTSMVLFGASLISKTGDIEPKSIDLSALSEYVHNNGSPTYYPQSWQFTWIDSRIVQMRVGYGETRPLWYVYGYYDIFSDTWSNELLDGIPDRAAYDWSLISPDLTRVLLLNTQSEPVLWNFTEKREIWRGDVADFEWGPLATWTFDSREIAFWTIDKIDAIQLLTRDGEHYTTVRQPYDLLEGQHASIGKWDFRWSPDGVLLALGGKIVDSRTDLATPMLYLYQPDEEKYVFQCQSGEAAESAHVASYFWSPDGQFLIPEYLPLRPESTPFRLYDWASQLVYQLDQNVYSAAGWVTEFSTNWK